MKTFKKCIECHEDKLLEKFCKTTSDTGRKYCTNCKDKLKSIGKWCYFDTKYYPETKRKKNKNCEFYIILKPEGYELSLHKSHMGTYKTPQACQQVIDKHHRREVMRAIEKKKELIDTYYDDL